MQRNSSPGGGPTVALRGLALGATAWATGRFLLLHLAAPRAALFWRAAAGVHQLLV